MFTRRAALAGLFASTAVRPTLAQAFPSRTITIIVPYPAGGPTDVLARLVAQHAAADLGQSIQVDNRGGGAGVIGSVAAQRAEPDGHTLVLGTNQTHATNQSLLKNHPFDAAKDFAAVVGHRGIAACARGAQGPRREGRRGVHRAGRGQAARPAARPASARPRT